MAERAINSERTKGEERTWFDVWQARRIASRANLRQFQLLTIAKRLSHANRENQKRRASHVHRENQSARASQQPRVNHSEGASQPFGENHGWRASQTR